MSNRYELRVSSRMSDTQLLDVVEEEVEKREEVEGEKREEEVEKWEEEVEKGEGVENDDEETVGPTEAVEILIEAAADSAEAVEAVADTAEDVEAVADTAEAVEAVADSAEALEALADSAEAVEAMADTAEAVEAVFLSDRMEDKDAKYKLLLKTLRSGQSY